VVEGQGMGLLDAACVAHWWYAVGGGGGVGDMLLL
jgi:hypothetical protein